MRQSVFLSLLITAFKCVSAFDVTKNSNVGFLHVLYDYFAQIIVFLFRQLAVYWGQNSYGVTHPSSSQQQQTLSYYCQDDSIDVFPLAFLDTYFAEGGLPHYDLSNVGFLRLRLLFIILKYLTKQICGSSSDPTFPGSELAECQFLATDIQVRPNHQLTSLQFNFFLGSRLVNPKERSLLLV